MTNVTLEKNENLNPSQETVTLVYTVAAPQPTLQSVLEEKMGNLDQQGDIPWLVRFMENPASPLPFPGKISLENHDCLHLLLDRGVSAQDEAFVVGFTMGNDVETKGIHKAIFKFFSRYLYPKKFQFSEEQLKTFELGYAYGKKLSQVCPNLNKINFRDYFNRTIGELKQMFKIDDEDIRLTTEFETWLQSK